MARKRKQDDPLAALLETATKEKLVDLLVLVASSRPTVRHECLDYLTRHAALSHNQKKQSEGEKLLALWDELAPDLDELDAYGGGDYDADFQVSNLLQEIAQALSRKKIEAAYRQQLLDHVLPYIESGNAGLDDDLYDVAYATCYTDDDGGPGGSPRDHEWRLETRPCPPYLSPTCISTYALSAPMKYSLALPG